MERESPDTMAPCPGVAMRSYQECFYPIPAPAYYSGIYSAPGRAAPYARAGTRGKCNIGILPGAGVCMGAGAAALLRAGHGPGPWGRAGNVYRLSRCPPTIAPHVGPGARATCGPYRGRAGCPVPGLVPPRRGVRYRVIPYYNGIVT